MNEKPKLNVWKIVVNGNAGVGKTALLVRFTEGSFDQGARSVSITSEWKEKDLKRFEGTGKDIKLQIYDTAGQEKFRTITSSYYRGAMGAVLVFDITNKATFDALQGWYDDLRHYLPDVPLVIVGNKTDLDKNRAVQTAEGEAFAKKLNVPYLETSAQSGDGVDDMFFTVTRLVNEEEVKMEKNRNRGNVQLRQQPTKKEKKGFCGLL